MNLHSGGCQGRKEGLSRDILLKFVNLGLCSAAQRSAQAAVGRGSLERAALWNIYGELKPKGRCTEASGAGFASRGAAFRRLGWLICCYIIIIFNACGGFFLPKCTWVLLEATQTPSIQGQGTLWMCLRHLEPSTHWVLIFPFLHQEPHCQPMGFVLRCSDVAATSLWGSLGALSRGRVGGWVPNPLPGTEARSLFTPAKFPGAQPAPLKHLQKGNPNKARLLSIRVYLNYWRSPSHGSRLNLYK